LKSGVRFAGPVVDVKRNFFEKVDRKLRKLE